MKFKTNLPNFLVVGTQKGGTTTVYSVLKNHPQIYLPQTKEIHYFDKNYDKPINWYLDFFNDAENRHKAIGEITPNYMYDSNVPQRIYNDLGSEIKLVFILRNPADRAFSNFKMNIERNNEKLNFKQAVELDLLRMKQNETYPIVFHYINRGFYVEQIKRFLHFFEKKNMQFLIFEDNILNNREETYKKIYNFIEVDFIDIPVNVKVTPNVSHRNKSFEKILNTANPINQLAKKIIPSKKIRTDIKYFFTKLNQKSNADKSELEAIRPFLINEVYKQSIIELEETIGMNLNKWLIY